MKANFIAYKLLVLFTILTVKTVGCLAEVPNTIGDYQVYYGKIKEKSKHLTIRRYMDIASNKTFYLVVNTENLCTKIMSDDSIQVSKVNLKNVNKQSNYGKLKEIACNSNQHPAGITEVNKKGYVLTTDLCPSSKPFDTDFFNYLIKNNISPVYLCISGKWIEKHNKDLDKIKNNKSIDIIWVNHSYNHTYKKQLPDNENFMLIPDTDITKEIIGNEIAMIRNGLTPSVFFRFPGLIANQDLSKKVLDWGLIPISSNAWLSKGQKVKEGSIILLHLNGNDKPGLKLFQKFLPATHLKPVYINN